ncbi:hypothetical protein D3C80_1220190 [compost metagenome]
MKSETMSDLVCERSSNSSCSANITQVLPEPGNPVSSIARFLASMAASRAFTAGLGMRLPPISRLHDLPIAEVSENDKRTSVRFIGGASIAPAIDMIAFRSSLVRRC